MRDEPEIGSCESAPSFGFLEAARSAGGVRAWAGDSSAARLGFVFFFEREESGRWESGKPAFGFPLFHGPPRRRCGNVGISPVVGEISKGLLERVGSLPLAFHAFHSPAISTALLALPEKGARGWPSNARVDDSELRSFLTRKDP